MSGVLACARNILFNKEKIIYQACLIQKSLFIKVCSVLMPLAMSSRCLWHQSLKHAEHVIAVCAIYVFDLSLIFSTIPLHSFCFYKITEPGIAVVRRRINIQIQTFLSSYVIAGHTPHLCSSSCVIKCCSFLWH